MNYPIKIVCCVVDQHNVTLYKEDGETIVIQQGDNRLKDLVANMVPAFEQSGPQFYMLTAEDMADRNTFADTEKKMGGVARFFKMVKSKAKELLEKFAEPIAPLVLGSTKKPEPVIVDGIELEQDDVVVLAPEEQRPLTKSAAAVAEIMATAIPASASGFSEPDAQGAEATTVIAVLDDNTVIPGVEALAQQAKAVSSGVSSGAAMANFLRRAGSIKRGHSVEDLLKFVQKGELPLADDGSVLVYKLLNRTSEEGVFVDVHSGNVRQRVGSFVHMAERLVDPNRSRDCSNGLHVARRDYLGTFSGNVCVLAKLAPEDVIAVPQYDARKLRAKGYHIIAELSDADRTRVRSDNPMEDQVLLGNCVAGNHIGIIEMVEITAAQGGGLRITPVKEGEEVMLDNSLKSESLDHLKTGTSKNAKIDARALALDLATPGTKDQTVQTLVGEGGVILAEPVLNPPSPVVAVTGQDGSTLALSADGVATLVKKPVAKLNEKELLLKAWGDAATDDEKLKAAKSIVAFKKAKKKSYAALGIPTLIWSMVNEMVDNASKPQPVAATPMASTVAALEANAGKPVKRSDLEVPATKKPTSTGSAKAPAKQKVAKAPAKAKLTPAKPAPADKGKKMTQQEEMAKLVALYEKNPDKPNARAIYAFKQKAKKGWDVLGVTDAKFIKKITERAKL